jgi:hypothetical protein
MDGFLAGGRDHDVTVAASSAPSLATRVCDRRKPAAISDLASAVDRLKTLMWLVWRNVRIFALLHFLQLRHRTEVGRTTQVLLRTSAKEVSLPQDVDVRGVETDR